MSITSAQIRAARALVRWSSTDLAARSGISLPTIQRVESAEGTPNTRLTTMEALKRTLEEAGVLFIAENGEGAGVRLKKQMPKGVRKGARK